MQDNCRLKSVINILYLSIYLHETRCSNAMYISHDGLHVLCYLIAQAML